eukprot:RCo027392
MASAAPLAPRIAKYYESRTIPAEECITVDGFCHVRPQCRHFFLTHFHSDHYQGLTKSFSAGTIHCSSATAALVEHRLRVSRSRLNVLPLNTEVTLEGGIRVVALDANHCPGAVMLLFTTALGTFLHTGDFRYTPALNEEPALKELRQRGLTVDTLFMDNTYGSPRYDFPPQSEAVEYVVGVAERALAGGALVLVGTYTLGKERVLTALASRCGRPVFVDDAKYELLRLAGLDMTLFARIGEELKASLQSTPETSGTSGDSPTRGLIAAISLGFLSYKGVDACVRTGNLPFLANLPLSTFPSVVAFNPTGWTHRGPRTTSKGFTQRQQGPFTVHAVPYSEHSSFSELQRFLSFLRPKRIVPTSDPSGYLEHRAQFEKFLWTPRVNGLLTLHSFLSASRSSSALPTDSQISEAAAEALVAEPGNGLPAESEELGNGNECSCSGLHESDSLPVSVLGTSAEDSLLASRACSSSDLCEVEEWGAVDLANPHPSLLVRQQWILRDLQNYHGRGAEPDSEKKPKRKPRAESGGSKVGVMEPQTASGGSSPHGGGLGTVSCCKERREGASQRKRARAAEEAGGENGVSQTWLNLLAAARRPLRQEAAKVSHRVEIVVVDD